MQRIRSSWIRAVIAGVGVMLISTVLAIPTRVAADEAKLEEVEAGEYVELITIAAQVAQVEQVEIREYQGERLGSVDDFRENSIKGVQYVNEETYTLTLDGLVDHPMRWSYVELDEMERLAKLVTIHCVEGWSVTALWEGIPLAHLLEQARLQEEANTVIFHAVDGYTTSLPLDFILEHNLIIADRINGILLPPENGFPFELVAEDRWGYKWIKWIVRIELSDDPSYRGFWESRGYSNKGDADGPRFGD
jgi:DMSO/TMAO reductase YedYZ molybdopterin-dependent catalytic subunit